MRKEKLKIEFCFSCYVNFHSPKSSSRMCSRTAKRNDGYDHTSSSDDEFFNESDGFGEKTTRN